MTELPTDSATESGPPAGLGGTRGVPPSCVEERRGLLLHPAFDPLTQTWFLDEPSCQSTSLRGLLDGLRLMGYRDVEFVGYYPQGYVAHRGLLHDARREADNHALELARKAVAAEPKIVRKPPPQKVGRKPVAKKYDHNFILNLWAFGRDAGEIQAMTGASKNYVGNVLWQARERKDPRAARRKTGRKTKCVQQPQPPEAPVGQISA